MGVDLVLGMLLKLVGSNVGGSVVGWVGGWLQRKQDLEVKKLELQFEEKKFAHEIAMRTVDIQIMDREIAGKERIASIEAEGKIGVAQFDALSKSYEDQFAGDGKAVGFSRAIRPLITLWFTFASSVLTIMILWVAWEKGVQFTVDQWKEWVGYAIAWVFFQAGVAIGWWFAMRAGKMPELRR
jgi:hypothetical protein